MTEIFNNEVGEKKTEANLPISAETESINWETTEEVIKVVGREKSDAKLNSEILALGISILKETGVDTDSLTDEQLKEARELGEKAILDKKREELREEKERIDIEESKMRKTEEREKMLKEVNDSHKISTFFDRVLRFDFFGFMKKKK